MLLSPLPSLVLSLSPFLSLPPGGAHTPAPLADQRARTHAALQMNLFGDFFDDGKLKAQTPYARPLLPKLIKERAASYVLREKLLSFSGEDFSVRDTEGNTVIQVESANINLGGLVIDKVRPALVLLVLHRPEMILSAANMSCLPRWNSENSLVAREGRIFTNTRLRTLSHSSLYQAASLSLARACSQMGFKDDAGDKFMSVERRMLATTTCYDSALARFTSDANVYRVACLSRPLASLFVWQFTI